MDSAMDILTKATVEAEELWLLSEVNPDGYLCRGCSVKAIPCSFQPHNKVRPYFKVRGKHDKECDVDGEEKLVGKGKSERLSNVNGEFPVPYPSKLVLRDYRRIAESTSSDELRDTNDSARPRVRANDGGESTSRGREANTIRPICRSFINYPFDRDLPLTIPELKGNSYKTIFKKLISNKLIRYQENMLFFASIRWNKPIETEHYLEVSVDSGIRDDNGKLTRGHKVRINWENWSKGKRTFVKNDLETARQEAIKEHEKKSPKKAYLFFIGRQDDEEIDIFYVVDHRLICCIVDEITFPKF